MVATGEGLGAGVILGERDKELQTSKIKKFFLRLIRNFWDLSISTPIPDMAMSLLILWGYILKLAKCGIFINFIFSPVEMYL